MVVPKQAREVSRNSGGGTWVRIMLYPAADRNRARLFRGAPAVPPSAYPRPAAGSVLRKSHVRMTQPNPEPRRSDAQHNRARILEAARDALTADGDASLNSIAKQAGVAAGTLYCTSPTGSRSYSPSTAPRYSGRWTGRRNCDNRSCCCGGRVA